MEGKLTVFFDPPFWVGTFEKIENNHCQAAPMVFGSEPTLPELILFALKNYSSMKFSQPVFMDPENEKPANYKRRMREIRRQILTPKKSTKAQQIIRQEYELKVDRKKIDIRENRLEVQNRKYLKRKIRVAEKQRGH